MRPPGARPPGRPATGDADRGKAPGRALGSAFRRPHGHHVQIDARRGSQVGLADDVLQGRRLRVGQAIVDDDEQINIATAGTKVADRQRSMENQRPSRSTNDIDDRPTDQLGRVQRGPFLAACHRAVLPDGSDRTMVVRSLREDDDRARSGSEDGAMTGVRDQVGTRAVA